MPRQSVRRKQVSPRRAGRAARVSARTDAPIEQLPQIRYKIPHYEIATREAVELIHHESCRILQEIGIEFRDDEAIQMWRDAGADVRGYRVRIDPKLLMSLVSLTPSSYAMHARDPKKNVTVGDGNAIFVPMYGAPYIRDLTGERRYGKLEDLQNFHKLSQMSPGLHSTNSIICEPMEIPVPHRHLHIMHSQITHADKPYLGIVTAKERAEDTMEMAKIVFGREYASHKPVITSVVNANSPLVWDATMLDALKVYARHNQPCLLTPFALCGASTPASAVGAVAQVNAEALAGIAFSQLIRPHCPQVYGQFMVAVDMRTGAPMGGTTEAAQMMFLIGQLARFYNLPWRTSGFHVGSKLPDAQAGYEANMLMHAAILSGANFIWHSAGWLEAGLVASMSKFVLDADQLRGWHKYSQGLDFEDLNDAMQAVREVGPAGHFLGTSHTYENFQRAFFMPELMDFNSYEQWLAEGAQDADTRARNRAAEMLENYEQPPLDEAIAEELAAFIAKREEEIPANVS